MLVQFWKHFLIAALIVTVTCFSLVLICNQLAHQTQVDHAKDDKTTRQAERHGVEPPIEQALKETLKELAQGFAGLIAGPSRR
jgi:hypothetical protein